MYSNHDLVHILTINKWTFTMPLSNEWVGRTVKYVKKVFLFFKIEKNIVHLFHAKMLFAKGHHAFSSQKRVLPPSDHLRIVFFSVIKHLLHVFRKKIILNLNLRPITRRTPNYSKVKYGLVNTFTAFMTPLQIIFFFSTISYSKTNHTKEIKFAYYIFLFFSFSVCE